MPRVLSKPLHPRYTDADAAVLHALCNIFHALAAPPAEVDALPAAGSGAGAAVQGEGQQGQQEEKQSSKVCVRMCVRECVRFGCAYVCS